MEKKETDNKMSLEQKEVLVNYLQANKEMIDGKFHPTVSPQSLKKKWEDLTRLLNSCTTGDKSKTVAGWKRTWRDIKTYTRRKYYLGLTDGGPPTKKGLSELEQKILCLMGNISMEGHEVAEVEGPIIIGTEAIVMDEEEESPTYQQVTYNESRIKPRKERYETDIKMSVEQKEVLVNYLLANREMTDSRVSPQSVKDKWEDLTRLLNSCSTAGKPKTIAGWKKSWRDIRSYTKRKYFEVMENRRRTGDGPHIKKELSELELNVINLMDLDGHNKDGESATFQQPTFEELMVISEVECEDASSSLSFVKCTLGNPQDQETESIIIEGSTSKGRERCLPKRRGQGSYTLSPIKRALNRTRKRHSTQEIDNKILKYLRNMDVHRKRMEDIQERMANSLQSISREVTEMKSDIHRMVNYVIQKGEE